MKDKLLDQDTTLLDVLKLPNRIDIGPHFLEATPSQKWKIPDFQVHSSLSKTVDEMENLIFEGTKVMRLDPPRFCRPAVTEAFNLDSNEIIQIHEGQNLPMNLMGMVLKQFYLYLKTDVFLINFRNISTGVAGHFCCNKI